MLTRILGLLGLESAVSRLRRVARDTEYKAREIGIGAAFGVAGGVMALVTFVCILIAVYFFARPAIGPGWALGLVVLIPAILTAVFGFLASSRFGRARRPAPLREEPSRGPEFVAPVSSASAFVAGRHGDVGSPPRIAASAELRSMLTDAVRSIFGTPPTTGTPVDGVIHRFTREAAASSDKTVDLAAEVMSRGSRTAVFGILASTVALGWFLARHPDKSASAQG